MPETTDVCSQLCCAPRRFLVTGVAGFIGSHILQALLELGQTVVGLDNFTTGTHANLADVLARVGSVKASRFRLIEGDIRDPAACARAMQGVELVLHHATLASVVGSMADTVSARSASADGFVNVLAAANSAGVERVVFASSSSVYGNDSSDVKTEERIGLLPSPDGAARLIDEAYAGTFCQTHRMSTVGLRYFDVFGPRQGVAGKYSAMIPLWVEALLHGEACVVYGDGGAIRDFCFVHDVVRANLLAALVTDVQVGRGIFNVGSGVGATVLELFSAIRRGVARYEPSAQNAVPRFEPARCGNEHSRPSIEYARLVLGYTPAFDLRRGIDDTVAWHAARRLRVPRVENVETSGP